jgi:hypothetical protein
LAGPIEGKGALSSWLRDQVGFGTRRGATRGRDEGRREGEARALLAALRARGIPVPDAARVRTLTEEDPERLERWVGRAVVAASLADVLDDPS